MKMTSRLLLAAILPGMLGFVFSCNAQAINSSTSFSTATIIDPSLAGKKAFTVTIPSGWRFQGTVIARLGYDLPAPVFRAYSPDGLTEMRLLPAFNWTVMSDTKSGWEGLGVPPERIYLNETLTASQFLDRYVRTLGPVQVFGPMSVGTAYQEQFDKLLSQINTNNSKVPKLGLTTTGNVAALRIETVNGTYTIEQRLRARVICSRWSKPLSGQAGNCTARMDVLRVPKGQFDALVDLVDSHSLTNAKHDDEWLAEVIAQMQNSLNVMRNYELPRPNQAALAMLRRQADDFRLTAKSRHELERELVIHDHVEYPQAPMMAMLRPLIVEPDWADFALDALPQIGSGGAIQPNKIHTWSSSSGQRYSTGNPNTNPNGVLAGAWTEVPTVRDNGQPQ